MAVSIALIILLGLCGDYLFRQIKLPGLVDTWRRLQHVSPNGFTR